jgi:hypothetical protein
MLDKENSFILNNIIIFYRGKPRATVAEMAPDVKIGQEFDFSTIKWLEYPVRTLYYNLI